jgi:hypothetical protein
MSPFFIHFFHPPFSVFASMVVLAACAVVVSIEIPHTERAATTSWRLIRSLLETL